MFHFTVIVHQMFVFFFENKIVSEGSSFTYDGRQFELLVHGVTGACVGTRPYGSGILGVAARKVMEGVRAFGEWLGVVDPPVQQNGGNNNNNNE